MKSFTEVRKRIADQTAGDPPCTRCNRPTPPATLSAYGARCGECFAAYCRTPADKPKRSSCAAEIAADGEAILRRRRGEL